KHYRPPERPDSVHVVHPKTGEEAWWPLFDAAGRPLFPELMAEKDAIKKVRLLDTFSVATTNIVAAPLLVPGAPRVGIWTTSDRPSKKLCARPNFATSCPLVHSVTAASLKEQTPI